MKMREAVMNELMREALLIAISNWEYDGEYEKAERAERLLKGEGENA